MHLADTLVDDYDVIELLHGLAADCAALLAVDAAGLMLSDQRGKLHVVASSTERARLLELFQLQADQGPCLDCFQTGQPVSAADLADYADIWPRFVVQGRREGYRSAHGLPMRLRSETIGTLNLFRADPGPIPAGDLQIGQALADVATIGIMQERAIRRGEVVAEQLQTALNTRVVIEQAKGVLAERGQLDMADAFAQLRSYARNHNQRLSDLARAVIVSANDVQAVLDHPGR
ncbi:MAG: GAF and ANTAR domain-containing protein [Pseudonocardiaceae bacterium]